MNSEIPADLRLLIDALNRYHAAYKRLNKKRDKVPMSDRLKVWPTFQREADELCGNIMRTERRIIETLLK